MPERAPTASLPMFDWPEAIWAHDALWQATATRLREHGIAAPDSLDRARRVEDVWDDPGLVVSQTCGFPFATRLRENVRLIATPIYGVDGCAGPYYSSVIVVRLEAPERRLADFRRRRIAFNGRGSLSGYVALLAAMKSCGLDAAALVWIETGSHRASITAVADDGADLAAIDPVCWGLAQRYEPGAVARLRVLGRTPLRPGLPFITAGARGDDEVATLRLVLGEAFASPQTEAAREALFLRGLAVLDPAEYEPIATLGDGR